MEAAKASHKNRDQSGQATELDENVQDSNPAQSGSISPVEDESEDGDKMNRGQDEELAIVKKENRILKEKGQPELLKEIRENFHNEPGILDARKLQKINMDQGRNLMALVDKYNTILQRAVESDKTVPFGTYIISKPEMKLIPVNITVDFDKQRISMSLWEKKIQGPL